jgi:hypothetical protein
MTLFDAVTVYVTWTEVYGYNIVVSLYTETRTDEPTVTAA